MLKVLYNQQKKVQDNSKIRIIKGGGGRPPQLKIADQILLTKRILIPSSHISNVRSLIGSQRISS
jgi:hypothetical protein